MATSKTDSKCAHQCRLQIWRQQHTVAGVPIVCLPIWHWYILRGD